MKITLLCFIAITLCVEGAVVLNNNEAEEGSRSRGCFSAIYSFGDSITDTGNALITSPGQSNGRLPYGETFFRRPTGRYSDGRIILDFLAEACGLPLLDPYLNTSSPHLGGINFAVGGATANNETYIKALNREAATNLSLDVQVDWFLDYKSKLCAQNPDCSQHLEQALFVVGEIGGNDYNYQLCGPNPLTLEQVEESIGDVVAAIQQALESLIDQGSARKIVVPNNFPIGCWTIYLSEYPLEPRDAMGCMPRFNRFAKAGNLRLQEMVQKLQARYSGHGVKIVQADYYGAALWILSSPQNFGIEQRFVACCGEEGSAYHFNGTDVCAMSEKTSVCADPWQYFNFDGIHLTEAGYRAMASLLLDPSLLFASPPLFGSLCPHLHLTSSS